MINKSTLSKNCLFLKPVSGCENYHEFIACIVIGSRIGIGILMRYRDSYRNRYKIWYRPISSKNLVLNDDIWVISFFFTVFQFEAFTGTKPVNGNLEAEVENLSVAGKVGKVIAGMIVCDGTKVFN